MLESRLHIELAGANVVRVRIPRDYRLRSCTSRGRADLNDLRERGLGVFVGINVSLHSTSGTLNECRQLDRRRRLRTSRTARWLELQRTNSSLCHVRETVKRSYL